MRWKAAGSAACAAMAAACAAWAQGAPAPPKDTSAASVAAWVKANLDAGPFTQLENDDQSVTFYLIDDEAPADARVRAWIRDDFFDAQPAAEGAYRSTNILTEMDCEKRALRALAIDWFPNLNLKGKPRSRDEQSPGWTYERGADPASQKVFDDACAAKQAKLAGPARSPFR